MQKEELKKLLGESPEDKHFYSKDGRVFKKLAQLAEALPNMSEEAFHHHVNNDKNDFHSWIKDVFRDLRLAKQIQEVRSRTLMASRIKARLSSLKSGVPINSIR